MSPQKSSNEDTTIQVRRQTSQSTEPGKDFLTGLPGELTGDILDRLDTQSVSRFGQVSRACSDQARSRWFREFRKKYIPAPAELNWSEESPQRARGVGAGAHVPNQAWRKMCNARQEIERRWEKAANDDDDDDLPKIFCLKQVAGRVHCVQFDDHKIIAGSADGKILIWNMHNLGRTLKSGTIAYMSTDPRVIYGNQTEQSLRANFLRGSILCLQYDAEIMITGSSNRIVTVWSIKDDYRPICHLRAHTDHVSDVCLGRQHIVTCSKDGMVYVWDRGDIMASKSPIYSTVLRKLEGHGTSIHSMRLCGDRLAGISNDEAVVWDLSTGTCKRWIDSLPSHFCSVELSEGGKSILVGTTALTIIEYDIATGKILPPCIRWGEVISSLHLDSVNNRLICSGGKSIFRYCGRADDNPVVSTYNKLKTGKILTVRCDYRRIVFTSTDGYHPIVVYDFGHEVPDAELLEAPPTANDPKAPLTSNPRPASSVMAMRPRR